MLIQTSVVLVISEKIKKCNTLKCFFLFNKHKQLQKKMVQTFDIDSIWLFPEIKVNPKGSVPYVYTVTYQE